MDTQSGALATSVVSEQELRTAAVEGLGLSQLDESTQNEILITVRQSLVIYIQTALVRALGPEKVAALDEIPESDTDLFARQLMVLLPNAKEVVQSAIETCINDNKIAFDKIISAQPGGSASE